MSESFGMMDQGYFVSRTEILNWVNSILHLDIQKIEQLASGSVYCQLLDIINPGVVTLSKINWNAKQEYEFINNLKILQSAFAKLKIKKYIEIEKLSKAKYQDNLEFIQWMKRYIEMNSAPELLLQYDAVGRRGGQEGNFKFADKKVIPKIYNQAAQIHQQQSTQSPTQKTVQAGALLQQKALPMHKTHSTGDQVGGHETIFRNSGKPKTQKQTQQEKGEGRTDSDLLSEIARLVGIQQYHSSSSGVNNQFQLQQQFQQQPQQPQQQYQVQFQNINFQNQHQPILDTLYNNTDDQNQQFVNLMNLQQNQEYTGQYQELQNPLQQGGQNEEFFDENLCDGNNNDFNQILNHHSMNLPQL